MTRKTDSERPDQSERLSLPATGAVTGAVNATLRMEAALVLMAAVTAYRTIGGSWMLFAIVFLLPDVTMLGYAINRRSGALLYNLGHSYISPALLALAGQAFAIPSADQLALIWAAHIGFDRLLGYGLKYPTAFGATHLGWRGRRMPAGHTMASSAQV